MFDAQTSAASTTNAAAAPEAVLAGGTVGTVGAGASASVSRAKAAPAGKKAAAAAVTAAAQPGAATLDKSFRDKAGDALAGQGAATVGEGAAPGACRPAGIEPDAEMDRIVAEAEKTWKREAEVQLVDLLDANSRGVLTLFPYTPRSFEAGKVYPVMTGHLDTRRVKVRVSAFVKRTEEGREFLSLAIGAQGQDHIGGAVFRSEEQDEDTGLWMLAPGKENERHGVISKTQRIEGTDAYETVFELRFYGRRRLTGAGVPYIKAQVYQERRDAQANGDADAYQKAMEGCF